MKLLDLINPVFLKRLQHMFSSYLGTSLMIADIHGTPLIEPISGVRMCSLIRNTPDGEVICESSDRQGGHETLLSKETHVYRCLAGFIDFSAAIVFRDEVIGLLVGGQVKTGDEDPGRLVSLSGETGVPADKLADAYSKMPCVREDELREKLIFIKQTIEFLCDLSSGYYEQHLKDVREVADAHARVKAAEDIADMFNKHLKELSDSVLDSPDAEGNIAGLRAELGGMLRQADAAREVIGESPEYLGCADKDYRISEVTYELQWVLNRAGSRYGGMVHVPRDIGEHVPPYLCGDPAAISEVVDRILAFMTNKKPDISISVMVDVKHDQYAALLCIMILSKQFILPDGCALRIDDALEGDLGMLLDTGDLEYLELTTASEIAKKLSAELSFGCFDEDGSGFVFSVPQLPAKGGFY